MHVATIVGVSPAPSDEFRNVLFAVVQELFEGEDAVGRDEGCVAEGVDLFLAKDVLGGLGVGGQRKEEGAEQQGSTENGRERGASAVAVGKSRWWNDGQRQASESVGKELRQKSIVNAVEVFEDALHGVVLVHGGDPHHVRKAMGGVFQEEFSVLEAFGIVGKCRFELGRVGIGVRDRFCGGSVVAAGHGAAGEFGPSSSL